MQVPALAELERERVRPDQRRDAGRAPERLVGAGCGGTTSAATTSARRRNARAARTHWPRRSAASTARPRPPHVDQPARARVEPGDR
ncbi:MAG: hypothetical protein KIT14_17020 [bacterium]|nr:hypothetical protein [bacterium]